MNVREKIKALAVLAALKRLERKSRGQIRELQEQKLRHILSCANELPYYRRIFQTHQINPMSCTMEDLQRLPILTKDIYRENLPENISQARPKEKIGYWYTSGSTGTPLAIAVGAKENVIGQVLVRYTSFKSGLKLTDTLCRSNGDPDNVEDRTIFQKMGFGRQYTLDLRNDIPHNIDMLNKLKPQVLGGFPSYLTLLVRCMQEKQISLPSIRLIRTGGEVLTPQTRHLLQTAFAAPVRDHYGTREFSQLSYECEYDRLHVIPSVAIIEVINQDEHGVGDALITSLYHEVFPFIRYKIGDRFKLSDAACPCGVPFQIVEYIEGRSNDFFVLPSGKLIMWRSVAQFKDIPGILEYQLIQKKPDYFEAHVKKNSLFTPASAELICKRVQDGCHGERVRVEIVFREVLDRGRTGKLQVAISEVAREN